VERLYSAENTAQRARLQALVARLSDDDLARPIGHDWTVGVALAHLAYWDRLWLGMIEDWERAGAVKLPPAGSFDSTNDDLLPQWLRVPPAEAKQEALAAAKAIDRKVEGLADTLAEAVLAARPRTLNRAIHRREHLDEIERALAS